MLKFIIRRVLLMIPILLGVSLVTFIIVRSIPGDPVRVLLGADARSTPEQIENIRRAYGLDQPLPVQYIKWLGHVVTGDLGQSLRTGRPLTQELGMRLPVTAQLTVFAAILGTIPAVLFGVLMRFTRSSVLEVMNQDYVRVARAKGLSQGRVIRRHVLPNAGIPVLTIAGIQVAALLGGTVIIEQIFALPGVGRYIYEAISNRDYPVVQSVTLVMAAIFVLVSLIVDVLYAVLDPRLRNR